MKRIQIIKIAIYIIMSIIAIMTTPNAIFNFNISRVRFKSIYFAIQMVAIPIMLELILYEFLTIIKDIELKDTFNFKNIEIFKRINYYVWFIVVMKCIINVPGDEIDLVYLLILALFTKILSSVVIEACKLKHYEQLLKEENELTI